MAFAPATLASANADISADAPGRFEELDAEGVRLGERGMADMLASAGDDGEVRVWAVPGGVWV